MHSKILLVDDDPDALEFLRLRLRDLDSGLRTASSGEQALDFVRDDIPDVLVLDVMMPDMNGFEVLYSLKRDVATRDIPVILVSARTIEGVSIPEAAGAVGKSSPGYLLKVRQMVMDVLDSPL